ncbi:DMT family transporter [Halosimplex salinum]|uniref:DMT family transporter n=1 Tax=Halosimplex salinum TaxID=1710538 RepID=UPI000F476D61|nr:EamA family transporter [Halosimplex salinum]
MARSRTVALFLFVTVVFGTAFPAIKTGLSFFPPLLFAAIRNLASGVFLLAYVATTADHRFPESRRDWGAVLPGGVFLIGGTGFGFVGQQFVPSGVSAVIFSLSPIVTGLFAWVFLPAERLAGRDYAGILLGFLGVAILLRPDPAALFDPTLFGKLLVLLAVVTVSLGTVLVRRSESTLPVPALTGWSMLLGAAIQFAVAVLAGESPAAIRVTPLAVATVLYLAVFIGAIGFVSFLTLLGEVGALKANLVTYLTPVVALAVGWLALDERVGLTTLAGFAVIVVGFAVLEGRELYGELFRYRGLTR